MFVDTLLLVTVAVISAVPYVNQLGVYSDDWSVIAQVSLAEHQTFTGLLAAIDSPDFAARPVFYTAMAAFFAAAGPNVWAFHVANTIVLTGVGLLLYALASRLHAPRPVALAVAMVYLIAPHYSATRFWMVAASLNVSLALFLASMLLQIHAETGPRASRGIWTACWVTLLGAALLTYETILPLVVIAPLIVAVSVRAPDLSGMRRRGLRIALIVWSATAGVLVWKVTHSSRVQDLPFGTKARWFQWFLGEEFHIAFVDFGLRLPLVSAEALRDEATGAILLASLAVGLVVASSLWLAGRGSAEKLPTALVAACGIVAGVLLWLLALSIFLVTIGPAPGATGVGTRLANVATIGVAVTVVGLAALAARLARSPQLRLVLFSILLGAYAMMSALLVNVVARYWVRAATAQQAVLDAVQDRFPTQLPSGTLLVDGVCPYTGPGIVFESSWDLRDALAVQYGASPDGAHIVTDRITAEPEGIRAALYDGFLITTYAYGDLHVLDTRSGDVTRLEDQAAALAYLKSRLPPDCAPGREGGGQAILGLNP